MLPSLPHQNTTRNNEDSIGDLLVEVEERLGISTISSLLWLRGPLWEAALYEAGLADTHSG